MKEKRWQDWLNLLIGIWLFISPWVIGFAGTRHAASWNAWILGVAHRRVLRDCGFDAAGVGRGHQHPARHLDGDLVVGHRRHDAARPKRTR